MKFCFFLWIVYFLLSSLSNFGIAQTQTQTQTQPSANTNSIAPVNTSQFLTKRTVEIEWEEVPGATQYDLEIYDGKNKKFIKTFTSKTNIFKLNVKMGKYYFRSRILDKFERSSEWTELAELLIAPPPTKITTKIPEDPHLFANKLTGLLDFSLNWDALPGVTEYRVVTQSPDGKVENEITVKGSSALLKVPPGQHQFFVKAILSDGTIGDKSETTSAISVLGAKIQKPVIQHKMIMTDKTKEKTHQVLFSSELSVAQFEGDLYYRGLEGTLWSKVRSYQALKDKEILFDHTYVPGRYKLRLKAIAAGFTASEYQEIEFTIKPTEPVLVAIPAETITFTKETKEN